MSLSDYTDLADMPMVQLGALRHALDGAMFIGLGLDEHGFSRSTGAPPNGLTVEEGIEQALVQLNTPMDPCEPMVATMTTLVDGEPVTIIVTEDPETA